MLNVNHVGFDYADQPVLHNVQLHVPARHLLHVRGSNGAGKTTLLKLMAGLLQPTVGEITYQKQRIVDHPTYQSSLRYVGHKSGISPLLTVRENVRYGVYASSEDAMNAAICAFGLRAWQDVPCGLLSQGLRRRVALLRLNIGESQIWYLDEPFVALDQAFIPILMACFAAHLDRGGIIVLTSHQAMPWFDGLRLDYWL